MKILNFAPFTFNGKQSDKASSDYVLNPRIEDSPQIPVIDNSDLIQKESLLELELAELELKKTSKIRKEKAKRKNLLEWLQTIRNIFSAKFEKHKGIFLISVLLFFASSFLHSKSFQIFLGIFLPETNQTLLFAVSLLISLALEGLATSLFESYEDNLSYAVYFVSACVIASMGFYEYSIGKPVFIAGWRTGLGLITLLGLFFSHKAMRSIEFFQSRKTFEKLPRTYRKEINTLLENLLAEHHKGNKEHRLDFRSLTRTYNVKSASLEKHLVRRGVYNKKYMKQLPAKRRTAKKFLKKDAV